MARKIFQAISDDTHTYAVIETASGGGGQYRHPVKLSTIKVENDDIDALTSTRILGNAKVDVIESWQVDSRSTGPKSNYALTRRLMLDELPGHVQGDVLHDTGLVANPESEFQATLDNIQKRIGAPAIWDSDVMPERTRLEITSEHANSTFKLLGTFVDSPQGRKQAQNCIDKARGYGAGGAYEMKSPGYQDLLSKQICVDRVFPDGQVQKLKRVPQDSRADQYPQTLLDAQLEEISRARSFLQHVALTPLTATPLTDLEENYFNSQRRINRLSNPKDDLLAELDHMEYGLKAIERRKELSDIVASHRPTADTLTKHAAQQACERADQEGWTELSDGVYLNSRESILEEQAQWDDGDSAKQVDFNQAPYWLTTDGGTEPVAITGAGDQDLLERVSVDERVASYGQEKAEVSAPATQPHRPPQELASASQVQEKRKAYGRAM